MLIFYSVEKDDDVLACILCFIAQTLNEITILNSIYNLLDD